MDNKKYSSFPQQFISEKEKTDEWCDQWVNAVVGYMSYSESPYKNSRVHDIQNYNIYNGHIELNDFKYITEQYGMAYPARLVNYPIISPKIDLLVGEDLRRPMDIKVNTVNKEAVIRKQDVKVSLIMKELVGDIQKDFQKNPKNLEKVLLKVLLVQKLQIMQRQVVRWFQHLHLEFLEVQQQLLS